MKPHCALSKFDFSYTRDSMKLQAGLGQLEALLSVLDVGLQRPFSCVCFVVVVIWLVGCCCCCCCCYVSFIASEVKLFVRHTFFLSQLYELIAYKL